MTPPIPHESRKVAALALAHEVADLLLAAEACPALGPDNRARAVALARAWFKDYCPRYRRDDVETNLVWVGRAVIALHQLRARTRLPDKHPDRITPDRVPALFVADAAAHWLNEADTYLRHCRRIDEHPPAEAEVEAIARRVAGWDREPAAA